MCGRFCLHGDILVSVRAVSRGSIFLLEKQNATNFFKITLLLKKNSLSYAIIRFKERI